MSTLVPNPDFSRNGGDGDTLIIPSSIPSYPSTRYAFTGSTALPYQLDQELSSFVDQIPTEGRVSEPGEQPYAVPNSFRQIIARRPADSPSTAPSGASESSLPPDTFAAGRIITAQDMIPVQRADTVGLTWYLKTADDRYRIAVACTKSIGEAVDLFRRFPDKVTRNADVEEFITMCRARRYRLTSERSPGRAINPEDLRRFPEVMAMVISGLGQETTAAQSSLHYGSASQ